MTQAEESEHIRLVNEVEALRQYVGELHQFIDRACRLAEDNRETLGLPGRAVLDEGRALLRKQI